MSLIKAFPIHALAHITGGGIVENLVRVIPDTTNLMLYKNSWTIPPIFPFLQKGGNIEDAEMMRTFNNGLGMIAVVPENLAQDIVEMLAGMDEKAFIIGNVVKRKKTDKVRFQWEEI